MIFGVGFYSYMVGNVIQMMEKYENDSELENEVIGRKDQPKSDMEIDQKLDMDDEKAEEDIQRDICLPSIKDSKLWRIKVVPGRERELVFKI